MASSPAIVIDGRDSAVTLESIRGSFRATDGEDKDRPRINKDQHGQRTGHESTRTNTDKGQATDQHGPTRIKTGHGPTRTNTDKGSRPRINTDQHGQRTGHGSTRTNTDKGQATDQHGPTRIKTGHGSTRTNTDKDRPRINTDQHGQRTGHGSTRTNTG